ncbi:hypothetical protein EMPS_00545 [Entomortierella parvispora]|uniref:Transcription activator GCR1-like domain-containing protein n=1 Tax=Entomortierella parvispora TaxID=205924 RepID=A0A9P3LRU5_9FUNG|nr:hypothetical protein EMPS_00545 [Entomortierella parvispora]
MVCWKQWCESKSFKDALGLTEAKILAFLEEFGLALEEKANRRIMERSANRSWKGQIPFSASRDLIRPLLEALREQRQPLVRNMAPPENRRVLRKYSAKRPLEPSTTPLPPPFQPPRKQQRLRLLEKQERGKEEEEDEEDEESQGDSLEVQQLDSDFEGVGQEDTDGGRSLKTSSKAVRQDTVKRAAGKRAARKQGSTGVDSILQKQSDGGDSMSQEDLGEDVADPEFFPYPIRRSIIEISDVWKEWTVSWKGSPSIESTIEEDPGLWERAKSRRRPLFTVLYTKERIVQLIRAGTANKKVASDSKAIQIMEEMRRKRTLAALVRDSKFKDLEAKWSS